MSKQEHLFMGIDAGTTVIKAVVFDQVGRELFIAQEDSPLESSQIDYQEMDMNKVWQATQKVISSLVNQAKTRAADIRVIGITGQGCGAWLVDKDGEAVRNAILWSDQRANDIVAGWVKEGIAEQIYKISGCDPFSGAQSAIIKWLSIHEPETLDKTSYALYCKDWLRYKLTGQIAVDSSEGSISYVDIYKEKYSEEILNLIGIATYRRLLPELQPCYEVSGTLLPEVAKELGLFSEVQVVGAAFDVAASAIGAGAIADGDACTIFGTALISEVVIEKPEIEPLNVGFTIPLGAKNRWVRMANTHLGMPNQDWFLKNFCYEDYQEAEKQRKNIFDYLQPIISAIPIGSEGVLFNPFIHAPGIRAPFLDKNAKGHFIGLAPHHTRHHLLRALYEGIVLAVMHMYDNIPRSVKKVNFAGGGARSDLWGQMLADALHAVVRVPSGSEFGAKGAVINAAVAAGYYDSYEAAVEQFITYEREYYPDEEAHKKYKKLFDLYAPLYQTLSETWQNFA